MAFTLSSEVGVDRDESDNVIQLRHTRKRYSPAQAGPGVVTLSDLCDHYVREVASIYRISGEESSTLSRGLTAEPLDEGLRLKKTGTKTILDTTVVSYQQTCCGLPVWDSNFSVVATTDPPAVVSSCSSLHSGVSLEGTTVEELRALGGFRPNSLSEALGVADTAGEGFALNQESRLLVYRYEPTERVEAIGIPGAGGPAAADSNGPVEADEQGQGVPLSGGGPSLPLPPVPAQIVPGRYYVVREILFELTVSGEGKLNWRAFVEPKSGAVLYLRALTSASSTCCVFETDPVSKTGNAVTAASPAAVLDAARTCGLPLENLDPPGSGVQELKGKWVRVENLAVPAIPAPTETVPFKFEYSAVTDNFSAVNAYYHTDWMYRLIEGLGFDLPTYFNGTSFPVRVDHRGERGEVNARANGNAAGNGMGAFRYGLVQSGQPVGIATSVRVCLHEFGHALLWDHVNSPNFGWAHSAGDTLAAILKDPDSKAPPERRFETFPFIMASNPGLQRRHDREVVDGWAWGGIFDDRQYGSEQILSTLMFRIYRVTGGDDPDLDVRRFAARYLTYLIVRAIGTLTATTTDPRVFATALMNADDLSVDFEGHPGGAWHKVVRWSFEKQGLYQPPGAPAPVVVPGAPPLVDVYIDDGRTGEYQPYLPEFGASPDVWNRRTADGGPSNEDPEVGITNYLYVRVSNRGTTAASAVEVKTYQGHAPERWPEDWSPTVTGSLAGPAIPSGASAVVGPFEWIPSASGSVSILASVSAPGDLSNADTVNGPIPTSRLVPHDNNLAMREFNAYDDIEKMKGSSFRMASGSTPEESTEWKAYGKKGIYVDVDTSASNFRSTPRYFTSLGGRNEHWTVTGVTSIYRATATGFRVYLRWSEGKLLTPEHAVSRRWHINWFAIED